MLRKLPLYVNNFSEAVVNITDGLVDGKFGFCLRFVVILGPVFFVPTVWKVWTYDNIESFRSVTWPLMLVVHIAGFIILCHNKSDWCIRFCTIIWFLMTSLIVLAINVR